MLYANYKRFRDINQVFTKIHVPIDGSESFFNEIHIANQIANKSNSKITLNPYLVISPSLYEYINLIGLVTLNKSI